MPRHPCLSGKVALASLPGVHTGRPATRQNFPTHRYNGDSKKILLTPGIAGAKLGFTRSTELIGAQRPGHEMGVGMTKRRRWKVALAVACLTLMVIPPSVAYAWSALIYAQGYYGANGFYRTTGFAPRNYDIAWHEAGTRWGVWYENSDGSDTPPGGFYSTDNPTRIDTNVGYARSHCNNVNDNSGVQWTCQTTTP